MVMKIYHETNMASIKQKMNEIRRSGRKPVLHNYYLNCEKDEEIFALFGNFSVVFWDDDHGVRRVYFYSVDSEELKALLLEVPEGVIMDYITRQKGDLQPLLESAGWTLLHEMKRFSSVGVTAEEWKEIEEKKKIFDLALWMKDKVRLATEDDCDAIYKKLYEVFDVRESHLCTKEELLDFIKKRWVVVYYDENRLMGFYMFKIEQFKPYGYQIWNGGGTEVYYSLIKEANILIREYVKDAPLGKVKPGYAWVNANNRKAMRANSIWGSKFDGLYDFVYEKLPRGTMTAIGEGNDGKNL